MADVYYPEGTRPPWEHSNRGVHLHSGAYQTGWMRPAEKREEWLARLTRIKATWVTILTSGMSCVEAIDGKPAVEWLLEREIVPIIRDHDFIRVPFRNMDCVAETARLYGNYGIKPIWIYRNEPLDDREWPNEVPPDALDIYINNFHEAARLILENGGIPAFADPLTDWEYCFSRMTDIADLWRNFQVCFSGHFYGKARPYDYPEDDVSRHGTLLTEEQHRLLLDDFYDHPSFNDISLDRINVYRTNLADPNKTFLDDAVCAGAWRNVRHAAREVMGAEIALMLNEGGWVPHDRPGTGPNNDDRWVQTTPKKVALKTLAFFEAQDHGMFAMTPWLLANALMGGGLGAPEDDCWCTGSWLDYYPEFDNTPVMNLLTASTPGQPVPPDPEPPDPEPPPCDDMLTRIRLYAQSIDNTLEAYLNG
jgi:hypothetical protein